MLVWSDAIPVHRPTRLHAGIALLRDFISRGLKPSSYWQ
jgi:hypothetical protein